MVAQKNSSNEVLDLEVKTKQLFWISYITRILISTFAGASLGIISGNPVVASAGMVGLGITSAIINWKDKN